MKTLRTFAFSCALLFLSSSGLSAQDSAERPDTLHAVARDSVVSVIRAPRTAADSVKPTPLVRGFSVGFDVCGAVMALATPYGQWEAFLRANLREKFFPVVEIGLGTSNHTQDETNLHYKVNAPYVRLGCDYNFLKDNASGNRIFGGVRYGFTTFKYDLDGPALTDPVYGTTQPFSFSGLRGTMHWGEVVAGVEARIWRIFHLGWTVRYRVRFHERQSDLGHAWYVPGYGKSDGHALGGTFNVVVDI